MLRIVVLIDQRYSQNIGQHNKVNRPVTDAQTMINPPMEQLIMNPGKFAPSFTSTSFIVNPLKMPLRASSTLFLKSLIRLSKEILTKRVAITIPTKNPIWAANTRSSSISQISVNLDVKGLIIALSSSIFIKLTNEVSPFQKNENMVS